MSSRRRIYSGLEGWLMSGEVLYNKTLTVTTGMESFSDALTRTINLSEENILIISNSGAHESVRILTSDLLGTTYFSYGVLVYGSGANSSNEYVVAKISDNSSNISFTSNNIRYSTKIPVLILAIPRTDV